MTPDCLGTLTCEHCWLQYFIYKQSAKQLLDICKSHIVFLKGKEFAKWTSQNTTVKG